MKIGVDLAGELKLSDEPYCWVFCDENGKKTVVDPDFVAPTAGILMPVFVKENSDFTAFWYASAEDGLTG